MSRINRGLAPLLAAWLLAPSFGACESQNESPITCAEDRCTIPVSLVEMLAGDTDALAREGRIVPAIRDGQVSGLKVHDLPPGGLGEALGLRNGDRIAAVDGERLDSLEDVEALRDRLRPGGSIELLVERDGAQSRLEWIVR